MGARAPRVPCSRRHALCLTFFIRHLVRLQQQYGDITLCRLSKLELTDTPGRSRYRNPIWGDKRDITLYQPRLTCFRISRQMSRNRVRRCCPCCRRRSVRGYAVYLHIDLGARSEASSIAQWYVRLRCRPQQLANSTSAAFSPGLSLLRIDQPLSPTTSMPVSTLLYGTLSGFTGCWFATMISSGHNNGSSQRRRKLLRYTASLIPFPSHIISLHKTMSRKFRKILFFNDSDEVAKPVSCKLYNWPINSRVLNIFLRTVDPFIKTLIVNVRLINYSVIAWNLPVLVLLLFRWRW